MRVCVFCASSFGRRDHYRRAAGALGAALAAAGIELVYGGGAVGLMGAVADGALRGGGAVTGVIPQALVAAELAHPGLTDLRVTATMHERKALMADLADGFVALPGGFGTFDELFEIVTWAQLGIHAKPIVLLDVPGDARRAEPGYWDPLVAMADHAVAEGFVPAAHAGLLLRAAGPVEAIELIRSAPDRPVPTPKWVERSSR